MKKLLTLFAALALGLTLQAKPAADSLAFRNLKKTDDQRIDLLLKTDKIKKIAVIGQWADSIETDWYGGEPAYRITIRRGLEQALGADGRNVRLLGADPQNGDLLGKNIEILYASSNAMSQAERLAKEADVVLVCVGNHPYGTTPL